MATQTVALSVDVDDLVLSEYEFSNLPYRNHRTNIRTEIMRLGELFDSTGARCTFFVPGYVLEARPDALDDVLDRGHEVACHGHRHIPSYRHTPASFEEDVGTALDLIRRATGITPRGYRAPCMTLVPVAHWAAPILWRMGFHYSSSVPGLAVAQHRFRYAPPLPFQWPCGLLELPVSIQRVLGLRVPVCGSVYSRLLPRLLVKYAIDKFRRESSYPLFYYCHPFEVFPKKLPAEILKRRWMMRLYTLGCRGFAQQLRWVLEQFSCVPYSEAKSMILARQAAPGSPVLAEER